jgi:hypothetical protein
VEYTPTGLTVSRNVTSSPQEGSPELWPRLGGEEVRGPTSGAVSVEETGTASVEAVKAPPVPGVQKPPHQVGKRFRDRHVAAPKKKKVKRPEGLRTRPAWLQQDRLGTSPAVCHGDAGCQAWRPRPCKPYGGWRQPPRPATRLWWWRSGGRGAEPRRGCRRAAEGVEPGCPDIPRRGGRRAARLAARWAAWNTSTKMGNLSL